MKHILNDLTEQEKNSIREQHTGGMKVMTENFSKLLNSKLGDVKPMVKEQLIIPEADKLAPQTKGPDLSCINPSVFTQTTSDGKKYHVIDNPNTVQGSVRERIVLYNDGTGYITQTGNKGKWKCGTSGVEFRTDADPSAVKYLGTITAAPAAKVNEPNLTSNCAASLDEIKQGSNKILMLGCKTDAVKKLQEMLGMEVKYQTGYFGNITKAKVIEFQKANNDAEGKPLVPDGKVGDKTYGAMLASKTPAQTTSNLRGATSAVKQYVPKFN
jgi:peptidoglycan hydrolase-like protein with peptidoglycan-binding domain